MADEKKGISASDVLKVLGTIALGGMLGGPAGGSRLRGARTSDILKGVTFSYPGLTDTFVYPVVYAPNPAGYANMNASIDRNLTFRYPLAQTLDEHNRAVVDGTEKNLESWWPGEDTKPRQDFHPSSSAVSDVRIMPDNTIQIRWGGKGKFYTYRGGSNPRESSEIAKELLTAPSIGRALPRNGRLKHDGKKDYAGTPDANIGFWGRRYAL